MELIKWFEELGKGDVEEVGGKGANLGEMSRAGLPVPPGFVVTAHTYHQFIRESGLGERIAKRLTGLNVDDNALLRSSCQQIQRLITEAKVSEQIQDEIARAYLHLSHEGGVEDDFVAVRSSATMEDSSAASFAGMNSTYLNVRGHESVVEAVKDCWASLYGDRVVFYRAKKGFNDEPVIAVVVQRMVNSEKSGVMFTVNPATGDHKSLVIEAAFGLGEVVVGGQVTPDFYEVDKETLNIKTIEPGHKDFKIVRNSDGENETVTLSPAEARARVLSDDEILALARLGLLDEKHYSSPQDTEWAIEADRKYLVQSRPITTLKTSQEKVEAVDTTVVKELLRGLGAGAGTASGRVKVLVSPDDGDKLERGDVLVARMTSPDWVPLMKRASAIVTDGGGMTCHAAIVSREMGLPCVVGTRNATNVLQDGMLVTVDATQGVIYAGHLLKEEQKEKADAAAAAVFRPAAPVTATRLYVNMSMPHEAERVAKEDVDGVGLLRAEFMLIDACDGMHPQLLLEQNRGGEFIDKMAQKLTIFTHAFHPRPVIYRATDFRSNEFRKLAGGEKYELPEENPMIGFRGCYRYTYNPELFKLELKVIEKVREQYKNLYLMIPFVRTLWEFKRCKEIIDSTPLGRDREMQLWVMAEVPSVVTWLEDYVKAGATGISIGSNDLTQLILGVDRDSEICSPLYDERDKAVLEAIQRIIETCHRLHITSSICGQAPSNYPEYAENLVKWGITSVSVNPDAIQRTRRNIFAAEQRVLLDAVRNNRNSDRSGAAYRRAEA